MCPRGVKGGAFAVSCSSTLLRISIVSSWAHGTFSIRFAASSVGFGSSSFIPDLNALVPDITHAFSYSVHSLNAVRCPRCLSWNRLPSFQGSHVHQVWGRGVFIFCAFEILPNGCSASWTSPSRLSFPRARITVAFFSPKLREPALLLLL